MSWISRIRDLIFVATENCSSGILFRAFVSMFLMVLILRLSGIVKNKQHLLSN